jgi:hypothetical protein
MRESAQTSQFKGHWDKMDGVLGASSRAGETSTRYNPSFRRRDPFRQVSRDLADILRLFHGSSLSLCALLSRLLLLLLRSFSYALLSSSSLLPYSDALSPSSSSSRNPRPRSPAPSFPSENPFTLNPSQQQT